MLLECASISVLMSLQSVKHRYINLCKLFFPLIHDIDDQVGEYSFLTQKTLNTNLMMNPTQYFSNYSTIEQIPDLPLRGR